MRTILRTSCALGATLAALTLAACGQQEAAAPAADPAPIVEAAPADLGRGGALNQRADAIEQRVLAAVAGGTMTPAQGQTAQDELAAARQTLSGMLAQTPGPLPQDSRLTVSQALDAIEADLPQ
jgi:hypothetical protein